MKNLFLSLIMMMSAVFFIVPADNAIVQAQTDPEAEINAVARDLHIQNVRSEGVTQWIHGDLGIQDIPSRQLLPVGEQITGWQLRKFYIEDEYVTLADISERPVVINIWASWCGPCRYEFPYLRDLTLENELNYDLWFVNSGDTSESSAYRFLRDLENSDQLLNFYDEEDAFNRYIGVNFFPSTFVVDTDGTILAAHIGVVTPTVMEFFNLVAANPELGSIDLDSVDVGDLGAQLQDINVDETQELTYGQQVAGYIDDSQWQYNYRFEGQAGQEVIIDMQAASEDMDPYLVLIGPDGERVVEVDDFDGRQDARIEATLEQSGTYVVVATRWLEAEGFSFGDYVLSIRTPDMVSDNPSVTILIPNVSLSGRLTRDLTQEVFVYNGAENEEVTFRLEHNLADEEHLNFQVRIGAGDRIVPFTQTEAGLLEATVTLPSTETYSVYVSRPQASRVDSITFTLSIITEREYVPSAPPELNEEEQDVPRL